MARAPDSYNPAKLQPGQEPMTDEKFAKHRSCETAPREHKWQWKWDISGQWSDEAICVHCGKTTILKREGP